MRMMYLHSDTGAFIHSSGEIKIIRVVFYPCASFLGDVDSCIYSGVYISIRARIAISILYGRSCSQQILLINIYILARV